jgi:hypothetical protein
LPREQFTFGETSKLLTLLDEAGRRSGVSRGQAFEDFLHMTVCALSGGALEDQYMKVVHRHSAGEKGSRGCDALAHLFGALVVAMEETRHDILGDLFQGAITYGEAGQFYTPEHICDLMAQMNLGDGSEAGTAGSKKMVRDPCCGSGRMLLAAAKLRPHWEFVGQDIDLRCVRMTAIALALRNLYGYVIWGDSLSTEQRLIYRTGFNGKGFIREASIGECPSLAQEAVQPSTSESDRQTVAPTPAGTQLRFF